MSHLSWVCMTRWYDLARPRVRNVLEREKRQTLVGRDAAAAFLRTREAASHDAQRESHVNCPSASA